METETEMETDPPLVCFLGGVINHAETSRAHAWIRSEGAVTDSGRPLIVQVSILLIAIDRFHCFVRTETVESIGRDQFQTVSCTPGKQLGLSGPVYKAFFFNLELLQVEIPRFLWRSDPELLLKLSAHRCANAQKIHSDCLFHTKSLRQSSHV